MSLNRPSYAFKMVFFVLMYSGSFLSSASLNDGLGGVVLCLCDTAAGREVKDLDGLGLAALGRKDHLQCALGVDDAVFGAILVAECVTADDYGLLPAGYETGDAGDDNGRAEDGSSSAGSEYSCFQLVWECLTSGFG
jgi:hypothetical protein